MSEQIVAIDKQLSEVLIPLKETMEARDAEQKRLGEALGDTTHKMQELAEKVSELAALKSRIEIAEARLNHPSTSEIKTDEVEEKGLNSEEYKRIFWKKLKYDNISPDEHKYAVELHKKVLSNAQDPTSGYLTTPPEYIREIIKPIDEFSPIRGLARVRTTSTRSVQLPKRTGTFSAVNVAEQGTRSETTGLTYGLEEIPVHEWYARVTITRQHLDDAAFDMAAVIAEEARMQFIVAEGADFVNGVKVNCSEGIMQNASIGSVNSGVADSFDSIDPFITVQHSVKSGYWPRSVWLMNRATIGVLRTLKNGVGDYLWEPSSQVANPNIYLGARVVEVPDMPDIGAGTYPVAFGDIYMGYTVVDRSGLDIMRDPYSAKSSGSVEFDIFRRWGGQVVLPEAIYKLKCSL